MLHDIVVYDTATCCIMPLYLILSMVVARAGRHIIIYIILSILYYVILYVYAITYVTIQYIYIYIYICISIAEAQQDGLIQPPDSAHYIAEVDLLEAETMLHVYMYVTYIYIDIYIERERECNVYVYIYIYIYIHINNDNACWRPRRCRSRAAARRSRLRRGGEGVWPTTSELSQQIVGFSGFRVRVLGFRI